MVDILRLVSEAKGNIFPTLSGLCKDDIKIIWDYVSTYIERQMSCQRGVHVAGLGTFTFSQQKLDMGSKFITVQRPIFLLEGKLAQSQCLKQARPMTAATTIPVVPLNYTAVADESSYDRLTVEGCVRETLLILLKGLASKCNISFTFRGIGVLFFNDNKVRMKFSRDFDNGAEKNERLRLALYNRPQTSPSVILGRETSNQQPQTPDPLTLPAVVSAEPGFNANRQGAFPPPSRADRDVGGGETLAQALSVSIKAPQLRPSKPSQTLQPARGNSVSPFEELETRPPRDAADRSTVSVPTSEGAGRRPKSNRDSISTGCGKAGYRQDGQLPPEEMCYLCLQRSHKNIPLYLNEEKLAEEKEQLKILVLNAQERDQTSLKNEQASINKQREYNKQLAAFNLREAEARKERKSDYPQFQVGENQKSSCILPDRPLTASHRAKQRHYGDELRNEIVGRMQLKAQAQQDRLLLERAEQVKLGHEIALQRNQQFLQKLESIKHYRRALDTQVGAGDGRVIFPPIQRKISQSRCTDQGEDSKDPSHNTYGRCDTPLLMAERRERAKKVSQEYLMTVAQKKREEMCQRHEQQQKEKEMLTVNGKELVMDRMGRFERMRNMRASLEDTWSFSTKLKRQREDEEKKLLRSGGGNLLDQCEEYRRCTQCQKKISNFGESNVWKNSLYTSCPIMQ